MKKKYYILFRSIFSITSLAIILLFPKNNTLCYEQKSIEDAIILCDREIQKNQNNRNELYKKQMELNNTNNKIRTEIKKRITLLKNKTNKRELGNKDLPVVNEEVEIIKDTTGKYHVNKDGYAQKQYEIPKEIKEPEKRLQYLIENYYNYLDYNKWIKLSHDIGVKAEFTFCLGQTETGLGHQLKSRYNYFNVGNNDRGSVTNMNGLEHSFVHLQYALNNKYLGKKNTLAELNPAHKLSLEYCKLEDTNCQYVYASSSENRGNNMMNCLSNIRGEPVLMDYTFRL